MKKFMMAAVALVCTVMIAMSMVSCGNDDNKGGSGKKEPKKLSGAEISYKANVSGTIFEVCDVFVTYYDANGQEQTEKATDTWSKTFIVKQFPAKLGISISLKRKEGVPATDESYTIDTNPTINFTGIAVDGSKTGTPTGVASEKFMSTPLANKLDEWIERIGVSMAVIRNLHTADNNTSLIWEVL